ncbi:MAG: DNA-binding protein WhiA [Mogibacterium sp.]|nr:DNA-binding protein WhiA [Mogibacterium sp.]
MSFSSDVKGELSRIEPGKKCDMLAEISGFLRVSASLRLAGGGRFSIVASTENPAIARHFKKLIKDYFGSTAKLEVSGSQMPGRSRGSSYRYSLTISPEEKSSQILRETGLLLIREGNDYFSDGIYFPIVRTKCCKKAYLRGIFLGCGTISNPLRSYHMEFVLSSPQAAQDLRKLIGSFVDLSANITQRKEASVVYLKRASYISDMLGIMGASTAMMEFENIHINRTARGEAQRMYNMDNANMERALSAAEEQVRLIRLIDQKIGLDNLSEPLRVVAQLRLEHPDAGLTELGELLDPPVKKPAVSKRFTKLKELARKLEEEPDLQYEDK